MLLILIVFMVSCMYTNVKNYQIVSQKPIIFDYFGAFWTNNIIYRLTTCPNTLQVMPSRVMSSWPLRIILSAMLG